MPKYYTSDIKMQFPQSEDYQEKRIVQIKDMDEIIKEELEWEKN